MDREQERGISIDPAKYATQPTFTIKDITLYILVMTEPKFDIPSHNFTANEIAEQLLNAGHITKEYSDQLKHPLTDEYRLIAPKDTDWFSFLESLGMDLKEADGRAIFLGLLIRFRLEVGIRKGVRDKDIVAIIPDHSADIAHAISYLNKRLATLRDMPEFNLEDIVKQHPCDFPEQIDFESDDEKVVGHPFGMFMQHPQNKPSKRNKRRFGK